ncbi:MAG: hypothetical protein WC382_11800 [Methanoregulaceae archaeon]|jgi:hypothetical protein
MTLAYDLRTGEVFIHLPHDRVQRVTRTMRMIEAIPFIQEERRRRRPPAWKAHYERHREEELARRKVYRQQHPEEIREYNRNYYEARKKGRSQSPMVRAKLASGVIG